MGQRLNPTIIISRFSTLILPFIALFTGILAPEKVAGILALAIASLPLAILSINIIVRYSRDPIIVASLLAIFIELSALVYLRTS